MLSFAAASGGNTAPASPPFAQVTCCLSSLPLDLKRYLAEHVHALDVHEKASFEARHERWRPRTGSTVGAFRLVSKEWAEVCEEWIWRDISLENRPLSNLFPLLRDVLPSKAGFLRSLRWTQSPPDAYNSQRAAQNPLAIPALVADLVTQSPLLSQIHLDPLWACPRTAHPLTSPVGSSRRVRLAADEAWKKAWVAACLPIYRALEDSARQGRVQHLYIGGDLEDEAFTSALVDLYGACRDGNKLRSLVINPDVTSSAPNSPNYQSSLQGDRYRAFLQSYFDLPLLESLEIWSPLPNYVAQLPTNWPNLRRLLLDCTGPEDPVAFLDFLRPLSATLTHLELYSMPREAFFETFPLSSASPTAPPIAPANPAAFLYFPNLVSLILGSPYRRTPLPYFSFSPSSSSPSSSPQPLSLSLKWCRAAAVSEVLDFIETHQDRLRFGNGVRTTCSDDHEVPFPRAERNLGAVEVEELRRQCEAYGVRFKVWTDSDDEEEEDEE
ncbi:hypothetical protein JCM8097_004698 [Rhodosporidiobolus ruineniae]